MNLIHCSYHKCLTFYFRRVCSTLYNRIFFLSNGHKHFNSGLEQFYNSYQSLKIASVNNHFLELNKLGEDFRISRFVRDPRDLVVSGYFYHKSGKESWCNIIDPSPENWKFVNGKAPSSMKEGYSFSSLLQDLDQEKGLIAELEFRKHHFDSMKKWPMDHPQILTLKYEHILGNERHAFDRIFSHYNLPKLHRTIGLALAERYSAKNQRGKIGHIRNTESNQWKKYFTPRVSEYFNAEYAELLEMYGYD